MTPNELATLKQLGDLECYASMDTRLCKKAYNHILTLQELYDEAEADRIYQIDLKKLYMTELNYTEDKVARLTSTLAAIAARFEDCLEGSIEHRTHVEALQAIES